MMADPASSPAVALSRHSPINDLISIILRTGVYLASAVLLVGLAVFFVKGPADTGLLRSVMRDSQVLPHVPDTLGAVARGVAILDPAALMQLGVLVLVATPVVRVAASIFIFLFETDWLYAVLTCIVLALLLFSIFFLGALGHG